MKISLRRRHALTVADGAFSHKIDYVTIFMEILNLEGHPNCITSSKITAILLNGLILPIGGASSGRVWACSLRSRLVYLNKHNKIRMSCKVPQRVNIKKIVIVYSAFY